MYLVDLLDAFAQSLESLKGNPVSPKIAPSMNFPVKLEPCGPVRLDALEKDNMYKLKSNNQQKHLHLAVFHCPSSGIALFFCAALPTRPKTILFDYSDSDIFGKKSYV